MDNRKFIKKGGLEKTDLEYILKLSDTINDDLEEFIFKNGNIIDKHNVHIGALMRALSLFIILNVTQEAEDELLEHFSDTVKRNITSLREFLEAQNKSKKE